ncbi:glycosyltransferase [Streptomyces sp. NRRL S-340]|uniref:glycosyltransferase n=1 Tax=Streptomyces sp. NRRL S-340 TaxID=1463901 RepID=UPI000B157678|nr:nucleotide disphospho-sugar-binding domain-containing protein [Streptomyces sp. NRRL S-340]
MSEIWKESGNGPFNRYVFGRLWPDRAGAKARDLITAWTRERPDLVMAECSDLGAHLAAQVLRLPLFAADNGLGPLLLDLWDTDVRPALAGLYGRHGQDAPAALPPLLVPAPLDWFYETPPSSARAVRRSVARHRSALTGRPVPSPGSRPLVYVSLGTLTTAMPGLRTVTESVYGEIIAALAGTDCDVIVSAGDLAEHLRSPGPRVRVVEHVPQPVLLHRVHLFVTHGGRASLLDAVESTTPVLGMGVLGDQPGNTAAFARRGLGPALDVGARRETIAAAVTAVLGTPHHADALRSARAELSRLPSPDLTELRDTAVSGAVG